MKKRTVSFTKVLLACTLLSALPAATWVYAADTTATQTQITKDDAIQLARTLGNLSEADWKLMSVDANTGQGAYNLYSHPTWELQFQTTAKNAYAGANVTLDATTGQLLSLNRWDKTVPQSGNLTREEAKATAEAFLKKVAPQQFQQTVANDSLSSVGYGPNGTYSFAYERQVNGAVVLGNIINVTVSTDGTITNYQLQWTDDAQFPATDGIIDASAAQQTYSDSLELRLQYQDYYKAQPIMKLVYSSSYLTNFASKGPAPAFYPIIDAKSGKLIDTTAQPVTTVNRPAPQILVPGGPTEAPTASSPLSQSDAELLATSSGLIPSGATLVSSNYNESNMKTWSLNYQMQSDDTMKPTINITLDALTGEVINFNSWSPQNGKGTPTYTDDQLKSKAIDLVKTLYKNRTGALYAPDTSNTDMGKEPGPVANRTYTFQQLKNGIPLPQSISVTIDATTGQVLNLFGMQIGGPGGAPMTYPSPDNLVTPDQAKATYMKNRPLRLSYMFPENADGSRSTTPVLVYTPAPMIFNASVDAKTGEWFNPSQNVQSPPEEPTDIKGHWAEKALQHYAELGLLELVDGKAHPDQNMTRATFVRLLVDSRGGGYVSGNTPTFEDVPTDSKYYTEIESAVERGWIAQDSKFRPDAPITREEAAAIFARVAGYKDLASHKEIFHLPYTDAARIDDWAYGSVAINYGLGVMQGVGNAFFPNQNITLAQEVTALDKLNAVQVVYPGK